MKKTKNEIFNDYDAFVDKFKTKKTTDDCYTPPAVYDVVRRYVGTLIDLSDKEVVRPFYPGGDYENYDYPDNAVVIDNPPFSIITKIVRFYKDKGIKFFLFAPHLTLFSPQIKELTYVVVDCRITYHNGAIVNTGFITNLMPGVLITTAPDLRMDIKEANGRQGAEISKIIYPTNVINPAAIGYLADHELVIPTGEFVRSLKVDGGRERKGIFGSGILVSDSVADEIQRLRESKARESRTKTLLLSDNEKQIIETLNIQELL